MQRRTQRRQKRRYHPVGVSSSQVSVAPTAAPPTRNTDVLSVLEDPQALLDLLESSKSNDREFACAAVASLSYVDPESCLGMFKENDVMLEGVLRLLCDPSAAVRAVCAGCLRNLAEGEEMCERLQKGGIQYGIEASLKKMLSDVESDKEETRLGGILAGLDLLLFIERLCEESNDILQTLVEVGIVDLLTQCLALHEMDAGLSLAAAMCLHVLTDGAEKAVLERFSSGAISYMDAMVTEEDIPLLLRVTVGGILCNLDVDFSVACNVVQVLAACVHNCVTESLDAVKPCLESFNEREHLLEMPKFLSLLSQGAEKQSFVLGLSEEAMSAFVDVEKWFAEAQSQRLALELLSNLAVVDAEEDESGSIRLQVGEVSTLLDTEGVIGQVAKLLPVYLSYSVAGASVEFEEEAALCVQQLQLRSIQFLGNSLMWANQDISTILEDCFSAASHLLDPSLRELQSSGSQTPKLAVPVEIIEECVQLCWAAVERDAQVVGFSTSHLDLFCGLVACESLPVHCRARAVGVLGCVGTARILSRKDFQTLVEVLVAALRCGKLLLVGEALQAVYSCFSEDDVNELLDGPSGILSSMEALIDTFGKELDVCRHELSEEELASMEEAMENIVPFLEYKASQ